MHDSEPLDIPITQLKPLRDRKVRDRDFKRIRDSISSIGLIEPLVVYPEGEVYLILDGAQRYRALQELKVEIVPCILGADREAFTGNRMVNRVTPVQESRMIAKSLSELDQDTIAAALGMMGIAHRLNKTLLSRLHPDVATAFDQGKLTRPCVQELTYVKPERQLEIFTAMDGYRDYSLAFARALILKTPPALREARRNKHDPWDKSVKQKKNLLKRLAEVEQKQDFYSRLYKQYTVDLLRLAIFARNLLNTPRIREYLDKVHPQLVARLDGIIAEAKG
jgi:hypothetical protein